eukprot:777839-Lingulodinium_polyedra.AAC.1
MARGPRPPRRPGPLGAAAARHPSTRCASRIRVRSRQTGLRPGSSLPAPKAARNGGAPTALRAGPSSPTRTS